MQRVIVVGGGVLGGMHALSARERGCEVVHLEREADARGASVRNFGLVWVSGRRGGAELELALRARARWEELATRIDGLGFRAHGSVTVASSDAELRVLEEAAARPDAGRRGYELLSPEAVRAVNPALRGEFAGGLWCRQDAIVEPRQVPRAIREHLLANGKRTNDGNDGNRTNDGNHGSYGNYGNGGNRANGGNHGSYGNGGKNGNGGYCWLSGREAVEVGPNAVRDQTGAWHRGDLVIVCTGAVHSGLVGGHLADFPAPPVRRVRLQMMQTRPFGGRLTTSLADGDSLRYYPAYELPARERLGPQPPVAARNKAQLLLVQRLDGGLTIGDTHEYDEPFAFDVDEDAYDHLRARAEALLGGPIPPVQRRWAGVYSQLTQDGLYHRSQVAPGVILVTGPGGRGMTCSPAIAEETFE